MINYDSQIHDVVSPRKWSRQSREIMFNKSQEATNALSRQKCELAKQKSELYAQVECLNYQMKLLQEQIKLQEQKEYKAKLEWLNPIIDTFHLHLVHIDIVRLCASYLPDNFCIKCNSLYLGSICVKCNLAVDYDHHIDKCVYTTLAPMKKACKKIFDDDPICPYDNDYGRNYTFCFVPINEDDKRLVNQWIELIYKNERSTNNSNECRRGKKCHLTLHFHVVDNSYKKLRDPAGLS